MKRHRKTSRSSRAKCEVVTGHFFFICLKSSSGPDPRFDPQKLRSSVAWWDDQLGGVHDRNQFSKKWYFGGISSVNTSENFQFVIHTVSVRTPGIRPLPINK